MKCPCCGQAMPDTPIVLDGQRFIVTDGQTTVKLGPSRFKLLSTMWQKRPYNFSLRELVDKLYADDIDGGPDNPDATVRTQIYFLKKRIAPLGIVIYNTKGPGAVYQISHVSKAVEPIEPPVKGRQYRTRGTRGWLYGI